MKASLILRCLLAVLITSLSSTLVHGQYYQWSNFAGQPGGIGNVDGTGTVARFNYPRAIAVDAAGNAYVADMFSQTIRKITPAGVVTTFAGKAGQSGSANGTGTAARFRNPFGLGISSGGILYVLDGTMVRKIVLSTGVVTTLAGQASEYGSTDGTGSAARFEELLGLAVGADGMIYVSDGENQNIRKITPAGVVTTLAGMAGEEGSADGTGTAARLSYPTGLTVDSAGNVFVADSGNNTIRKITPAGVVTTLAGLAGVDAFADGTGSAARFDNPTGIVVRPNGDLYVADSNNAILRKVTQAGVVTTFVGTAGIYGSADGTGAAASFRSCTSLAVDKKGDFYVTDDDNQNIRKVTAAGVVTTLAGQVPHRGDTDGTGAAALFNLPQDLAIGPNDELYISDAYNFKVRKATANGEITTYAGTGTYGALDGPVATATLGYGFGLTADATGNFFVTDTYRNTIRKIAAGDREVSTFAGTANAYGSVDGMGAAARFKSPYGMATAADGTLYVADQTDHTIRKITPAGDVTTLAGTVDLGGYLDGTGTAARFYQPNDVAVDADNNVYVADSYSNTIRKITPGGVVTTVAGVGLVSGSADGTGTAARFNFPTGVAVDAFGNLIVCDSRNHTIRKITPAGVVTTVGGMAPFAAAADGLGTASRFSTPTRVVIAASGVVYVSDSRNNRIMKGVPLPEIVVEEPVSTDLKDGMATVDFGQVDITTDKVKTFTVRNPGATSLTGLELSVTGADASDFVAAGLGVKLLPGQSTTFTVTFNADHSGARAAVLHIVSNDADEASFDINLKATTLDTPIITSMSTPRIDFENLNTGFNVQATHPTLVPTYQWFKNGAKIAGATTNGLSFIKMKLTDGATYTVAVTCNKVTVQRSTSLTVVRYAEETLVAPINGKLTPTVLYGGPATFEWTHDTVPVVGASSNKLTLTALNAVTSPGLYKCKAIAPGGAFLTAGNITVRVFDAKPIVAQLQGFLDGAVGKPYTHQIGVNNSVNLTPVSYSATGLPDGVKLNPKTGFISGVPTTAKNYKIKVTATNTFGSHSSLEDTMTVDPLPTGASGTFQGLVSARNAINGGLGGRIELTVASTAGITGSLTMGTKTYPFSGRMVIGGANPVTDINVARAGLPALEMHLEFDTVKQLITAATSSVRYVADSAVIQGWRQVWKSTGTAPLNLATPTPKVFTFGLRPTTPLAGEPAGDGYGSFTLAKDGKVTVAGKTGDGEAYTCSTFAGPQGQILLFQTLYTPKGSLLGLLDIDPMDTGALNADVLEGSVAWVRPASTKRVYAAGFGPVALTAFGARYVAPVAPALILGLTVNVDKAKITFADGGLMGASINPNVGTFDIQAGNKVSLPTALSAGNPGSVKITALSATTGVFTGSFVLNDSETRAAFAGKSLARTATFNGILTQDAMGHVGVGHFLLAEMPHDAMLPTTPATTPTTSAMLSGSVLLEKK